MKIEIDLNSELGDRIISVILLGSMESLHEEIVELRQKEYLMDFQLQDLADAKGWMVALKRVYKYYNADISILKNFS